MPTQVLEPIRKAGLHRPSRLAWRRGRLPLFIWSSCYFGLLAYVYIYRLAQWDYLGFWNGGTDFQRLSACYLLAILPLAWMRIRVERFSTFVHWIIYFFVYIPAVLIPVLQGLTTDVMTLSLAIFCSFSAITLFPHFRSGEPRWRPSRRAFWSGFWTFYAVLFGYALFVFRDNLSLSSLYDVYGQRSIASEVATGTLVGYATGMLSGCLNPFLMAVGLRYRLYGLLTFALAGQVFVYATFALKSVLITIPILYIFYRVLLRERVVRIWKLAAMICISIVVPLLLVELVDVDESPLIQNVVALVFMRTYGMVGAITGIYYEFFSRNALTYFSHINFVRLFVDYPYALSIGEVIGDSLGFDMNSNANFLATDGIAGAGKAGVVGVGFVVAAILNTVDRLVPMANHRLLCIASVSIAMSLANTSVFTTLLTGGLLLLVLITHVWRDALAPLPRRLSATPRRPKANDHAPV